MSSAVGMEIGGGIPPCGWRGGGAGRLSLAQLGELAGGMDYAAAGQAVRRFDKRLLKEPALRRQINHLKAQLSKVETWPQWPAPICPLVEAATCNACTDRGLA